MQQALGGLQAGHILYAHFPTVCHQRSCVPLQVPAKDGFCRALRAAEEATQHSAQQRKAEQRAGFSLGRLAERLYKPVAAGTAKMLKSASAVPARRQLAETSTQPHLSFAPGPAPANYTYTPRAGREASSSAQPQQTQQQPQQGLVANGQLSQNQGGVRYGPYATASRPTTLASSGGAQAEPSLLDSSDVASSAQQQLRSAPATPAAIAAPSTGWALLLLPGCRMQSCQHACRVLMSLSWTADDVGSHFHGPSEYFACCTGPLPRLWHGPRSTLATRPRLPHPPSPCSKVRCKVLIWTYQLLTWGDRASHEDAVCACQSYRPDCWHFCCSSQDHRCLRQTQGR